MIPPELPAILKDSYAARLQFNIDQPIGDAVAIVRHVMADRLGLSLADKDALDQLDDAARALRGRADRRGGGCPVSGDLVSVSDDLA